MGDNNFFSDSDLSDIFKELDEANSSIEKAGTTDDDEETLASQRRFEEIIKKHRNEGKGNI